jgi:F-type H+-transporting ATPase subunit b
MLLNFVLLLAGLVYFLRKPIGQALTGRHEKIRGDVNESERLRVEAETMLRDYGEKLAALDAEISKLLTEAKEDGEKERARILERARVAAERIVEDARQAAARETERVKARLQKEVIDQAILAAARKLQGRVTEKEHHLFADELIRKLEGGNGSS